MAGRDVDLINVKLRIEAGEWVFMKGVIRK